MLSCEEVVVGATLTNEQMLSGFGNFFPVQCSAVLADVAYLPSSHLAPVHCTPCGYHKLLFSGSAIL